MLISASTAKALFGDADPMDKVIRMDDKLNAKVTGVYADLPAQLQFSRYVFYLLPGNLKLSRIPG